MSKIKQELVKATGEEAKRGESEEDHLGRVILAVAKLSDPDWARISKEAQNWFNDAVDVRNDNKKNGRSNPLPPFPDAEKPKAEATTRRRRADDDEPKQEERLTKVGDTATVRTKRGKEYTGEVVEISDAIIVLKGEDGEDEFDMDKVESVTVLNGDAGGEDAPWEPSVGDTVELTTKRGKKYTGEIVEIDDKVVVVKGSDGEDEFDMDKVGSIEPVGGGKSQAREADPEPEQRTTRRASSAAADDADDKKKRSSNPRGVSVGGRIREIMCDDMGISEEDVGKILKKEGIDFRAPTLTMIYKDTATVFELLKANKKLK